VGGGGVGGGGGVTFHVGGREEGDGATKILKAAKKCDNGKLKRGEAGPKTFVLSSPEQRKDDPTRSERPGPSPRQRLKKPMKIEPFSGRPDKAAGPRKSRVHLLRIKG